jgi:predicted ABC-type ATPase
MPTGVLVCGPSGVGKSSQMETFLRNARAPKSFVLVDPDRLEAVDHKEASKKAIAKVHELIEEGNPFV